MTENDFEEISAPANQGDEPATEPDTEPSNDSSGINWLEMLARLGLGEVAVRIGTNLLTVVVIGIVVWLMTFFYKVPEASQTIDSGPTAIPQVDISSIPQMPVNYVGIQRKASIHTNIPDRPRQEVVKYTVVEGDTVIGIAEKFNIKPGTVLFGNQYVLYDDPHRLAIGKELNILPVDGVYYEWHEGDGLNGVAKTFGVNPDAIINYQPNKLDPKTIGDYAKPNIQPGTWIIVPGGTREFSAWTVPTGVTRSSPASARVAGAGSCGSITDGAVGLGSFVWPSSKHYVSGFDYSPETNHRGIDIAGNSGELVWSVDAGVIVYAGWNDYGYGNMVMIDHGTGWQSLYAHLDSITIGCGQSVDQGSSIGTLGSTGNSSGPHLHFELMHTLYSKVNPWDFLH